jgi:hypothetical protein
MLQGSNRASTRQPPSANGALEAFADTSRSYICVYEYIYMYICVGCRNITQQLYTNGQSAISRLYYSVSVRPPLRDFSSLYCTLQSSVYVGGTKRTSSASLIFLRLGDVHGCIPLTPSLQVEKRTKRTPKSIPMYPLRNGPRAFEDGS